MKTKSPFASNLRRLIGFALCLTGALLALLAFAIYPGATALAQPPQENSGIEFGQSYHNDVSPALRDLPTIWPPSQPKGEEEREAREANLNPKLPLPLHVDVPDPVIDSGNLLKTLIPDIPSPSLNFDGIPFPGVACNCAPPDTDGEVGQTQYVQIVNEGYQVFDKATGASLLGPSAITAIWAGFGGVCQNNGSGDPIVLYDHIANRWIISQFAGTAVPTDECIAVSTTCDATGSYHRYAFHLGSNFFDYPHLSVWPDGYYMAMNVFNSSGTAFLGPQPFAFDRAKMLPGCLPLSLPQESPAEGPSLPSCRAILTDRFSPLPAPPPFVSFPGSGTYRSASSTPILPRRRTRPLLSSAARRLRALRVLSHHAKLCASIGNDKQAGRHRGSFDVQTCLPQFRDPRIGRGELHRERGWRGRRALVRVAQRNHRANGLPAEHLST